jgi:hypothetical protein
MGEDMTYQIDKDYGKEIQEKLIKEYRQESLEGDIRRAKEDIKILQSFLIAAERQLNIVKVTPLKYYVEFRKEHNYSTKHINYIINIFQLPDIPDAERNANRMYSWSHDDCSRKGTHNSPFLGNEKKDAIAHALAMSAKYGNCEIVGNAAELIKKKDVVIL